MKSSSLVLASLRHYWRSHLGLLLGVFLASTILSGSLLVGDSVRASLRRAAEQRLGKVQSGLIGGERWFTEELARKTHSAPLIIVNGSVAASGGQARANTVQVLGVDDGFWKLSPRSHEIVLEKDTLAVNESLARKLHVNVGDTVLVRLENPSAISRDAPLSGEANQDDTLRRKIGAIVSGEDFGNFQLRASQIAPDNVFIPLADLAEALGKKGRVNGIVSANEEPALHLKENTSIPWGEVQWERVPAFNDTTLNTVASHEDFGLKLAHLKSEWELTTDRIFLDDAIAEKILKTVPSSHGVLTYLINGFSSEKGRAPYSFVSAASAVAPSEGGTENSTVITQWLADDLQLAIGDNLEIRYFTVGLGRELKEQTANLNVSAILPMTDPRVNPSWTPDFPGVSDAKNCRDWQPGIPMKLDAIRPKDEDYWKQYKTTPKAFISLSAGQKLWENRFGKLTAIRFPDTGQDLKSICEQLVSNLRLADIGLTVRDFKGEATAAARGSVDFGGLFIGLSVFIIASSLIFSVLLFVFTIEKRAAQIGLLLAIGWREKQVRRSILGEAGLVALMGTTLGLLGGVAYTKLALFGLNNVWSDAAVGLKLSFQASPATLAISFFCSLIATLGTLWWGSRRLFKTQPKDLLAGEVCSLVRKASKNSTEPNPGDLLSNTVVSAVCVAGVSPRKASWNPSSWARRPRHTQARGPRYLLNDTRNERSMLKAELQQISPWSPRFWLRFLPLMLFVLAIVLSILGSRATNPEKIAGMFFGAGFMLLVAGLMLISRRIKSAALRENTATSLTQIGVRNITRRPGRSLAVIGMMAGGIFLVIAVNAFRLGPEVDPAKPDSGTGGFALIGESTLPIYEDLNTQAGRDAFALDDKIMKGVRVVPFRVRDGDDASCLNLNKAQRPMLTAVNSKLLADRKSFSFTEGSWTALRGGSPSEIPAVADQATAMWGLGKGIGDTVPYTDSQGHEFKVKLVGLLSGSVLQGKIIIDEENFLAKYPDSAGYKFFLVDDASSLALQSRDAGEHTPGSGEPGYGQNIAAVSTHLTQQLETRGLALQSTVARLAAFNAVQNTYIGIFTVLGGLGVLLGTAGLGVLTMRNVLERRGEFGLMQALGFRRRALQNMVLSEHAVLLVGGLILGLLSAAIAVWPNVKQSGGALPVAFLLWLNLGILLFGIIICWFAAACAVRGKLLDAVRRE